MQREGVILTGSPRTSEKVHQIGAPSRKIAMKLVKTVAAGTAALGVGVVDSEPLLLNRVFEVDARTLKIRNTHFVDDNLDAITEITADISIEEALVEVELIDEP